MLLRTSVVAATIMMNSLAGTTSNTPEKTVFVIAGATAVGKTDAAIALAERLGTAIISADSRQCYREMSIGTAKPSAEELARVKHFFIDEFSVTEHISAADYERLALEYLQNIFQEKDHAIVCGGTGLYIKALSEGLDEMPEVPESVTQEIQMLYEQNGLAWLQQAVLSEDPEFYETADTENPARLLRALAFRRATGKSILTFRTGQRKPRPYRFVKCVLDLPRAVLYERINLRVEKMMESGLLEEVRSLAPYKHLKNLQTVGYSELFACLDGEWSLEFAIEKIKQHTRNYAKRQLTWFRKDPEYHWLDARAIDLNDQIMALKK